TGTSTRRQIRTVACPVYTSGGWSRRETLWRHLLFRRNRYRACYRLHDPVLADHKTKSADRNQGTCQRKVMPSTEHQGQNTFITFNYDTLLDDTLKSLKVPFSYGTKSDDWNLDESVNPSDHGPNPQVEVLKLHGSVNWAWSTDRTTASRQCMGIMRPYGRRN